MNLNAYRSLFVNESGSPLPEGGVRLTFFGTTMCLLDDGETQLLLDAHLTRPGLGRMLFGKLRTDAALVDRVLAAHPMDRLAAIFVSHTHYDHVLDAAYIAQKTGAVLHGSRSAMNVGRGGGLPEDRLALFQPGEPVRVGAFEITVLPSVHSKPNAINDDLGVEITRPLAQPARRRDYTEGGSFDFLIRHGARTTLVRPSCNYIPGALKDVRADTLLLGIGCMGKESRGFMDAFYAETVACVRPKRIIPVHWDNFFLPLRAPLKPQTALADNMAASLDYLLPRLKADGIAFELLDVFGETFL